MSSSISPSGPEPENKSPNSALSSPGSKAEKTGPRTRLNVRFVETDFDPATVRLVVLPIAPRTPG